MKNKVKHEMRTRAQMLRGLVNLLRDDMEYICSDVYDFDLVAMGESIREAKETVQSIIDHMAELEYALYLTKRDDPA